MDTRSFDSYRVTDGSHRMFAGRLPPQQVLQLHYKLALTVDDIAIIDSDEP